MADADHYLNPPVQSGRRRATTLANVDRVERLSMYERGQYGMLTPPLYIHHSRIPHHESTRGIQERRGVQPLLRNYRVGVPVRTGPETSMSLTVPSGLQSNARLYMAADTEDLSGSVLRHPDGTAEWREGMAALPRQAQEALAKDTENLSPAVMEQIARDDTQASIDAARQRQVRSMEDQRVRERDESEDRFAAAEAARPSIEEYFENLTNEGPVFAADPDHDVNRFPWHPWHPHRAKRRRLQTDADSEQTGRGMMSPRRRRPKATHHQKERDVLRLCKPAPNRRGSTVQNLVRSLTGEKSDIYIV